MCVPDVFQIQKEMRAAIYTAGITKYLHLLLLYSEYEQST